MRFNLFDRIALGIAVIFLGVIAARPLFMPEVAKTNSATAHFYREPITHLLVAPDRSQAQGKVMIDLFPGNIWGFPTAQDLPYPIDTFKAQAAASSPIYLGKFDLAAARR